MARSASLGRGFESCRRSSSYHHCPRAAAGSQQRALPVPVAMRGGGRLELGTTTSRRRTEASPLLPSVALDARRSPQSRRERSEWVVARKKYLLRLFQFKNETEAKIVLNLVFCGSLANVAFVFGRNAAPAKRKAGGNDSRGRRDGSNRKKAVQRGRKR